MLRVTRSPHTPHRVLVEGTVTRHSGDSLLGVARELQGTVWILDLGGVSFADSAGVALLARLRHDGARLVGASPLLRELLAQLASGPAVADDPASQLVTALRRGDPTAHSRLVREYAAEVLATARRLVCRQHDGCPMPSQGAAEGDARRLVCEAFAAASAATPPGRDSELLPWLLTFLVREAIRGCHAHDDAQSVHSLLPRFTADGERLPDAADRHPPQTPGALPAHRVRACVAELPRLHRAVLVLCDVEARGIALTAQIVGLELAEARKTLHQARQALRHLFGHAVACASSPAMPESTLSA